MELQILIPSLEPM